MRDLSSLIVNVAHNPTELLNNYECSIFITIAMPGTAVGYR
mgnify:CR=1 FL=1